MSDRPTPETDARTYVSSFGASTVPAEFARLLERERDEARQELEEYRSIAENIGAKKAVSEKEKAIRERDEWAAMCGRYKQERDEAREDLEFRRGLYKVQEEYLEKAIRERDELLNEIQRLRLDAQREAEHHDRMVKELESLYDQLKS